MDVIYDQIFFQFRYHVMLQLG